MRIWNRLSTLLRYPPILYPRRYVHALRRSVSRRRLERDLRRYRAAGFVFHPPNHLFSPCIPKDGVVVDVGVGEYPDLSIHMISEYGVRAVCVDPTRKHKPGLELLSRDVKNLTYHQLAVGGNDGTADFFESRVPGHESGSMHAGHQNVRTDATVSYPVTLVTISTLLDTLGLDQVDLLKLDLEGAEYDALLALDVATARRIRQLIVEFHHGSVSGIHSRHTERAKRYVASLGMVPLSYGRDCLFLGPDIGEPR